MKDKIIYNILLVIIRFIFSILYSVLTINLIHYVMQTKFVILFTHHNKRNYFRRGLYEISKSQNKDSKSEG